jgi:hypothetical protein
MVCRHWEAAPDVRAAARISPVMPMGRPKSADLGMSPASTSWSTSRVIATVKAAALRAHRTQHVSIDRHFFHLPDLDRDL